MVLFLRNKSFNVTIILSDYQLRWWRLPIEERACRKTRLGGGDYQLRISAIPPWQHMFRMYFESNKITRIEIVFMFSQR